MASKEAFLQDISQGYTFKGEYLVLGGGMLDGTCLPEAQIKIPLRTLNRHGLIAGATGTGKTKTLQVLAEQLSLAGVPSMVMDIKGDLSGLAQPGSDHPKIQERHTLLGIPFEPSAFPVEMLTLSEQDGVRLRATVTEFGPVLFGKILDLSDVQESVVSVVFKYCDDNDMPLLDLEDFKKVLQYLSNEGKEEIEKEYGRISTSSVGTILRKIVALEQQGADRFFGETSFDVDDLCRFDDQGRGIVSILRLNDLQDKPALFSTFMMSLLAEVYATFPEVGDPDRPNLVLFIDEAHLVFQNASKELLNQIETIVKLIRSKGVGLFFITQTPTDIPDSVLGQLGFKVQHALRAFTAKDREAIKKAVQNFPITEHYELESLITSMGIGEALVTALNEKGIPTPLAHTLLRAPTSRMDVLTPEELKSVIGKSALARKYREPVDRESAHEIITKKLEAAHAEEQQAEMRKQQEAARSNSGSTTSRRQEKSTVEKIFDDPLTRQIGRTVARELTRGLLGVLGLGGKSTRRRR
jgi:hypothetical protein